MHLFPHLLSLLKLLGHDEKDAPYLFGLHNGQNATMLLHGEVPTIVLHHCSMCK